MSDISVPGPKGHKEPERVKSLFDELAEDVAAEVAVPDFKIAVEMRPHYEVRFSADLPQHLLMTWQRHFRLNNSDGDVDANKLACTIVVNQARAILKHGSEITNPDDGMNVTFKSREFQQVMRVADAHECVRKFFVQDGMVQAVATAILKQAGYDKEVRPDPTETS